MYKTVLRTLRGWGRSSAAARLALNVCTLGLMLAAAPIAGAQASSICGSLLASYDQALVQGDLQVCSASTAVFSGPTFNSGSSNVNYSDATWGTGSVIIGKQGGVQFTSAVVDARHRNYALGVVQTGSSLPSNLTATVWGTDGQGNEIAVPVQIPPLSGSFPRSSYVPIFAPTVPADGSSSLDPGVLQQFAAQYLQTALLYQSYLQQLRRDFPKLIVDLAQLAKNEAALAALITTFEALLSASAIQPELLPVAEAVGVALALSEITHYVLITNDFGKALAQIDQSYRNALSVYQQLASKTFLPNRIEFSGVSDDAGSLILGGFGQRYRNDFQFVSSSLPNIALTQGTSQFFDQSGAQIAAGSITTLNFDDPTTGNVIFGTSNISITSGAAAGVFLYRSGVPLTPFVENPPGSGDLYATVQFQFSQTSSVYQNAINGSLTTGLTGFTTVGNVSLVTAPNGQMVVQLSEGSPASLSTALSIPSGAAFLAFDFSWLGPFTPSEDATFSVDFTGSTAVTQLFQSSANADQSLHTSNPQRMVVAIPPAIQGQLGVLRFLLNPSPSDGVSSAVYLGAFDALAATPDTTPPTSTSTVLPGTNNSGWNNADVTATLIGLDNAGGSGVKEIHFSLTGAQTDSLIVPGAVASVTISIEGTTSLTYFAVDNAGNQEQAQTLTINVDKTPPSVSTSRTPPNSNGWNNTSVMVSFACTDSLSGLAPGSPPAPTTVSTQGAGQSVTGTCQDLAGNMSTATISGINIDATAPTIAVTTPANGVTYTANQLINAAYNCTDAGSGLATCTGTVPSGSKIDTTPSGSLASKTFTVSATDVAGNVSSKQISYQVSQPFCHYVTLGISPSTVARGGKVTVNGTVCEYRPNSECEIYVGWTTWAEVLCQYEYCDVYNSAVHNSRWHIENYFVPILYSDECVHRYVYHHCDNARGWDTG